MSANLFRVIVRWGLSNRYHDSLYTYPGWRYGRASKIFIRLLWAAARSGLIVGPEGGLYEDWRPNWRFWTWGIDGGLGPAGKRVAVPYQRPWWRRLV
jgi:hypothetical protein